MAVTLNATTSSGLVTTADNSGQFVFQNNGTNSLILPTSGTVTIAAQTGTLYAAGPTFHATSAGTQTVTTATITKILFATEDWDTNSNFASSTFTPTVAGYYQINAVVRATFGTAASGCGVNIYKNGASWAVNNAISSSSTRTDVAISDLVYCNGSTDYIEIYSTQNGTGTITIGNVSFFSGCLMRGA